MAEFQKQGIDIELTEDVAQGNYSNLAIISHSTSEFIIDFATILPGLKKAKVKSRVILTPEHAKRVLLSLQENITRYESDIAKIEIPKSHVTTDDPIINMGPMGNAKYTENQIRTIVVDVVIMKKGPRPYGFGPEYFP